MEEIVQQFSSEQFGELRTVEQDGRVLFCAKDVAAALGYKDTVNAIKQHCRGVAIHHPIVDSLGREQTARFITEGDVYRLVAHSKLEGAQRFESWVFDEVLPAIRRHGVYATPRAVERMLADPDTMIATLKALKAERAKVAALTEDNARMLPKATMYDVAIEAEGTMTVTQAARYLGQIDRAVTQRRLFARLRADELLCKRSNAPTRYAIDHGYMVQVLSTRGDGRANAPYARITRKGLDWCVEHYCAASALTGAA